MLYDTHCHLDYYLIENNENQLKQEEINILNEIIQNCKENNVNFVNTICVEIDKFEKIYNISNLFDNIYCSIGQHPLYFKNNLEDFIKKINYFLDKEKNNTQKKIIGIGECGLDFFKISKIENTNYSLDIEEIKKNQIEFFQNQIYIAKTTNLPLIIHTREAEEETYNIIKNYNYFNGVLHSFTGSKNFMKKMLDLGFFVSFSGIVTFKNAKEIQENLQYCPIDRILIETDAPFLSPEPVRGKQNNPKNLIYIFDFVKKLINNNYLEEILFNNSLKLFKI